MSETNEAYIVLATYTVEPSKRVSVKLFNTANEGVILAEDSAPNYSGNGLQRAVRKAFDQLLNTPTINDLKRNEEENK